MNVINPIPAVKQRKEDLATSRTAILVLGMHRSGTSAFTRVMNLLGCQLPSTLLPSADDNSAGFWESGQVVAFNDRVLAVAGSRWDDWLPLNPGWIASAARNDFVIRAREVLQAEFGASPILVLKDPRICRLAPLWLEALEGLNIQPAIALPVRHPGEVADSLEARAGSQGGFGLLLWLRHVLEAEIATRGMPRYFFGYDQLLADWGNVVDGLERVTSVTLPGRSALTEAVVTDFLSESLRHQRRHCGHALEASMPEWVRSAYAIMRRWCEEGEQAEDFPALDAIRASFNAAAPSFAAAIARGVDRGDAPPLISQAELFEVSTQLQTALAARDEMSQQLNEANSRFDASSINWQAEISRTKAELLTVNAARDELNAALVESQRQGQEELERAWSDADTEKKLRLRADDELHRLTTQIESLADKLAVIDERIRADAEALATAQALLNKTERALDGATCDRQNMQMVLEGREAELQQARGRNARADTELAQLTMFLAEAEQKLEEEVSRSKDFLQRLELIKKIAAVREGKPKWWAMASLQTRRAYETKLLEQQGLFDAANYLRNNPDVAAAGYDALNHYLTHGIFESR